MGGGAWRLTGFLVLSLAWLANAFRTPHPERLVMHPITIDVSGDAQGMNGAPERYSGYFDLNRLIIGVDRHARVLV